MAVTINGTTGVAGVDGSASTPAVQGGDTNTGVFFPAADTVAVSTNGTERMRVDSAGNVGIGTSSPSTYAAGGGTLSISQSSAGAEVTPLAIVNPNGTANTQVSLAFTPNTNIPLAKISAIRTTSGGLTSMTFGTYDGSSIVEAARIDSSGNLLVGTTSTVVGGSNTFQIVSSTNGPIKIRNSSASSGKYWNSGPDTTSAYIIYNQVGTGVYISDGATSWSANSDERLKTDLVSITNAANKVLSLRAVTGRYKTDNEGTRRAFLIAQDVQKVLPEAVNVQGDEHGTLGLQYTDVIPLLVAAIQELNAKVETQAAEIAALKGN